ncbi:MAG: hypothetical protein F6J93_07125 [Oscillatoria sp. SIO1A7]|nr:hypothetical protein [Oscillatoria sp. SIO1A7]
MRWNPVSGASGYRVTVEDDLGDIWWETETAGTEISYNGKPLERGKNYILIVETDNGAASDEGLPGLGFSLLNADDAHQVNAVANLLKEGELTEEAEALQLAHLYTGYKLRAEAIATLEALAETGAKNIADRELALLKNYIDRQPTEEERREHGIPDDLEVTLNNIFMFGDAKGVNHMELLIGGTMLLSEEPTPEVFSVENLRQKIVGLLEKVNSLTPGLMSFLKDVEELDGANNIGDESAAWKLQGKLIGFPLLLDLAIFRNGKIVVFTGMAYFDNTVNTVEATEIARLLESRIPR